MSLKRSLAVTVGVIVLCLSGCATILDGPTQKVIAHCTPPDGIMIVTDGNQVPYTDGYIELNKKRDVHFVTFRKDGYYDSTLSFHHEVNPFWPVADIIFGPAYPLALFLDWQVGSFYRIEPNNINVVLRKKE